MLAVSSEDDIKSLTGTLTAPCSREFSRTNVIMLRLTGSANSERLWDAWPLALYSLT